MGLSYESFEKIICPENKRHKVYGNLLLFLFFLGVLLPIFLSILFHLNQFTWHCLVLFFTFSFMALFWLNVWYDYYDNKRKRRLKGLKEIYESYYWLVTRLDPFFLSLPEGEERPAYLDSLVPAYFKSQKEETERHKEDMPFQECTADALFRDYTTANELRPDSIPDLKTFYNWVFTTFSEHVKKGMYFLYIKNGDGIPILCLIDLDRLYKKEGLEWHTNYSDPGRLVAYFNEQHLENLKKLSDC